mgnify:CR=1 FL=1
MLCVISGHVRLKELGKGVSHEKLNFLVSGQKLEATGDFSDLVPGSCNYIRCEFDFDAEWNDMVKCRISKNQFAACRVLACDSKKVTVA